MGLGCFLANAGLTQVNSDFGDARQSNESFSFVAICTDYPL
jgi:hypothetical protein